MLPAPLQDLVIRVAALDGPLSDRLADTLTRLARATEALVWARDRVPALLACAGDGEVLGCLVEEARALTGAPEVWAMRWSGAPPEGSLEAIAGVGSGETAVALGEALRAPDTLSRTFVARALREGRPAWSDDARAEAALRGAASIHAAALRSIGCLPVGRRTVLYVADPSTPARFGPDARARLGALCELAGPFLERAPGRRVEAPPVPGLVGRSRPMLELAGAVRAFAPMPWPALVLGETGTGKESVARALHACSPRRDHPFQAVNCGAIPDELAESLLFGHERGSFTGADRRREGLVEATGDGTLFLDEVGELSPRVQVKLLRLLQEGTYTRVGGDRELRFTGRIVAATHRGIDGGSDAFRADLYHRLAACVLRVPPLRDRREDIPALADHLVARALAQLPGVPPLAVDASVVRWLQAAEWPGNVRELENTLRGAIALAIARGSGRIELQDVLPTSAWRSGPAVAAPPPSPAPRPFTGATLWSPPPTGTPPATGATPPPTPAAAPAPPAAPPPTAAASPWLSEAWSPDTSLPPDTSPLPAPSQATVPPPSPATPPVALADAVDAATRAQVLAALTAAGGNKSAAARSLGVSRQWLHTLLRRMEGSP